MSDESPTQPSAVYHSRIEWIDTDAAGIYHNSTVIRLVEAAEAQLMRAHGLPGYFAVAPRVRFEADFETPLHFGQPVSTRVVLARVGRSSMTFDFEVWGEPDEDPGRPRRRAAHGRYVTAHVITGDDGPVSTPWPADWVAALSPNLSAARPPDAP